MFLTVVVVYRDCILSGSSYLIKNQHIFRFFKGYSFHPLHAVSEYFPEAEITLS